MPPVNRPSLPLPLRVLMALAALLLTLGTAQAQRSFTSSAGGGGPGEYVVQQAYQTLRPCNPGDARADGCTMGTGPANAADAAAYAMQFGNSRGEQWTYLANATDGLAQPLFAFQVLGSTAATARLEVLTSFRHNLVLAVDGTWADPALGGAARDWVAYFVFRDVQAEDAVEPVNAQPLAPETFGASLLGRQQQTTVLFFDTLSDTVIDPDLGPVTYIGQTAGLQLRGATAYFFSVAALAPGAGAAVPEPGTLLLLSAAVAAAAVQRRRRVSR